jgi:mono/diheme cytochrome c family protein
MKSAWIGAWLCVGGLIMTACSGKKADPSDCLNAAGVDIGTGPVRQLTLGAIDASEAEKGAVLFKNNCSSCHRLDAKLVGPALQGVTQRRAPEWIMNMILDPDQMIRQDPQAKQLFSVFNVPMQRMGLSQDDARRILEYLRTCDHAPEK